MIPPTDEEQDAIFAFVARAKKEFPNIQLVAAERIPGFDKRLLVGLSLPNQSTFSDDQAEGLYRLAVRFSLDEGYSLTLDLDNEIGGSAKLDIGFLSDKKANILYLFRRYAWLVMMLLIVVTLIVVLRTVENFFYYRDLGYPRAPTYSDLSKAGLVNESKLKRLHESIDIVNHLARHKYVRSLSEQESITAP